MVKCMSTANDIWVQALGLPNDERAALAKQLLLSLEDDACDADNDAAWAVEIDARLDAIEQGRHQTCDWREALTEIRAKLSRRSREQTP
jgi:putative addiction module component (TIGR02574 family)